MAKVKDMVIASASYGRFFREDKICVGDESRLYEQSQWGLWEGLMEEKEKG